MEKLNIIECRESLIGSFFTDDRGCAHCNREHTLIYIHSGELEITEEGCTTVLHPGECAFMRRDNRLWLQKRACEEHPYCSVVMKFSRNYLKGYFHTLNRRAIPSDIKRKKESLYKFNGNSQQVVNLFESIIPYFTESCTPSEEVLEEKLAKGMSIILNTDFNLYASLFDFVEPWKIDLLDFMEKNYMNELSMEEMAYHTGRSLATFKRDFKKVSDTTPQKWIIRRRLEEALRLVRKGGKTVSQICFAVGFTNLSYFSRIFKDMYGFPPSLVQI